MIIGVWMLSIVVRTFGMGRNGLVCSLRCDVFLGISVMVGL